MSLVVYQFSLLYKTILNYVCTLSAKVAVGKSFYQIKYVEQ